MVSILVTILTVTLVFGSNPYFVIGTNGPQTYQFGYDSQEKGAPRLMREESRLSDGTVVGRYGYTDPFGTFRVVKYVAGPNGYYAFEDVGGASPSIPLFFKATARQKEETSVEQEKSFSHQLATKFNPPLYHPEAHLTENLKDSLKTGDLEKQGKSTVRPDFERFQIEKHVHGHKYDETKDSHLNRNPVYSNENEDKYQVPVKTKTEPIFEEEDIFKEQESIRVATDSRTYTESTRSFQPQRQTIDLTRSFILQNSQNNAQDSQGHSHYENGRINTTPSPSPSSTPSQFHNHYFRLLPTWTASPSTSSYRTSPTPYKSSQMPNYNNDRPNNFNHGYLFSSFASTMRPTKSEPTVTSNPAKFNKEVTTDAIKQKKQSALGIDSSLIKEKITTSTTNKLNESDLIYQKLTTISMDFNGPENDNVTATTISPIKTTAKVNDYSTASKKPTNVINRAMDEAVKMANLAKTVKLFMTMTPSPTTVPPELNLRESISTAQSLESERHHINLVKRLGLLLEEEFQNSRRTTTPLTTEPSSSLPTSTITSFRPTIKLSTQSLSSLTTPSLSTLKARSSISSPYPPSFKNRFGTRISGEYYVWPLQFGKKNKTKPMVSSAAQKTTKPYFEISEGQTTAEPVKKKEKNITEFDESIKTDGLYELREAIARTTKAYSVAASDKKLIPDLLITTPFVNPETTSLNKAATLAISTEEIEEEISIESTTPIPEESTQNNQIKFDKTESNFSSFEPETHSTEDKKESTTPIPEKPILVEEIKFENIATELRNKGNHSDKFPKDWSFRLTDDHPKEGDGNNGSAASNEYDEKHYIWPYNLYEKIDYSDEESTIKESKIVEDELELTLSTNSFGSSVSTVPTTQPMTTTTPFVTTFSEETTTQAPTTISETMTTPVATSPISTTTTPTTLQPTKSTSPEPTTYTTLETTTSTTESAPYSYPPTTLETIQPSTQFTTKITTPFTTTEKTETITSPSTNIVNLTTTKEPITVSEATSTTTKENREVTHNVVKLKKTEAMMLEPKVDALIRLGSLKPVDHLDNPTINIKKVYINQLLASTEKPFAPQPLLPRPDYDDNQNYVPPVQFLSHPWEDNGSELPEVSSENLDHKKEFLIDEKRNKISFSSSNANNRRKVKSRVVMRIGNRLGKRIASRLYIPPIRVLSTPDELNAHSNSF